MLDVFQKLSEIKPDIRPYILEVEAYVWLTKYKQWSLEKPEFFTYDYKIQNKDIYIEVKKGYADLTQKQIINLYEGKEEDIKTFYIINNRTHSQDDGFILKDSFETINGEFYLYEIEINLYLRSNNRLYDALISTFGMRSFLSAYGPAEYRNKINQIFEKLREEGLVEHIPFTNKPVNPPKSEKIES